LTGGFPCQSFSIIGKRLGIRDTRGILFFEVEKILKAKRPYALLLENVKQLVTIDGGQTFETMLSKLHDLGYYTHWKVLNALDFGIPQKRERVIIVGFLEDHPFNFPQKQTKRTRLEEILEPEEQVHSKHFISNHIATKLKQKVNLSYEYATIWHENKSGNIGIHDYSCALRANASYNYLLVNGKRRLTPRENLRLMGFPDTYKIVVPDSAVRKQAGNSVVIPMIQAVAEEMMNALKQSPVTIKATKKQLEMPQKTSWQQSIWEERHRQLTEYAK
jgi:DNA (cytosine-5)-methyltransferase 1